MFRERTICRYPMLISVDPGVLEFDLPVCRIMRDLERITGTSRCSPNPVFRHLQIKQLVHPSREYHIRVNHDNPLILYHPECT